MRTGPDGRAVPGRTAPIAGLEFLDTGNPRDVSDVAALHAAWLPGSPVTRLGASFVERFYYTALVDGGLLGCSVCKRDGRVVGFASYSARPGDLVRQGVRRHPGMLAGILLAGVLRSPSRLRDIAAVTRALSRRGVQVPPPEAGSGEALSLATDPAHRDYVPPGGTTRMPLRLFDDYIDFFRAAAVPSFFGIVEPGNTPSQRMFEARGCRAEPMTLGGEPRIRYVYSYRPEAVR